MRFKLKKSHLEMFNVLTKLVLTKQNLEVIFEILKGKFGDDLWDHESPMENISLEQKSNRNMYNFLWL